MRYCEIPGVTHWTYLMQPYIRNVQVFVCPSDTSPIVPEDPVNDRQVPKLSYINNYAAIPAHDYLPAGDAAMDAPAQTIVLTERRKFLPNSQYVIAPYKGTSGFLDTSENGQPCSKTPICPDPTNVSQATNCYAYIDTPTFLKNQDRGAVAKNAAKWDSEFPLVRAYWNRHRDGSNYVFYDGHAKWLRIEQTLGPTHFLWGTKFYPQSAPGLAKCP